LSELLDENPLAQCLNACQEGQINLHRGLHQDFGYERRRSAKGIQEGKAMTVTGHKTNSMFKRYCIEELDSQRDALDAVTV
jgi:hypothetical protein